MQIYILGSSRKAISPPRDTYRYLPPPALPILTLSLTITCDAEQNNLSSFAERAVTVLSSKGKLDWDRRDSKGYTPVMLAAFHNNAWLVKHLIDEVNIKPDDPSQLTREGAPQVGDTLTSNRVGEGEKGGCALSMKLGGEEFYAGQVPGLRLPILTLTVLSMALSKSSNAIIK